MLCVDNCLVRSLLRQPPPPIILLFCCLDLYTTLLKETKLVWWISSNKLTGHPQRRLLNNYVHTTLLKCHALMRHHAWGLYQLVVSSKWVISKCVHHALCSESSKSGSCKTSNFGWLRNTLTFIQNWIIQIIQIWTISSTFQFYVVTTDILYLWPHSFGANLMHYEMKLHLNEATDFEVCS